MNYLTLGIHFPKPEHRDDFIDAAKKVAVTARTCKGLVDSGLLIDTGNDRIVMFSLWEDQEVALEASKILRPLIAEFPFADWDRRPSDNMVGLERVI